MLHRSRICAILIDCPEGRIERSVKFWSGALGRSVVAKTNPSSPYTRLETPEGSTLDIFLQEIRSQESRLHFDIETDDVEAEVCRLERLGARRRQHVFVVGKTGVGKSTLVSNMVIPDLRSNAGLCILDPHGGTIEQLLSYIPRHRTNQVAYISPGDQDFAVGLNFLQQRQGQPTHLVVSEIVSSVRHLWVV